MENQTQPYYSVQAQKFPKSKPYDYFYKIIIIGDPYCGKTSLLLRTTMNKRNETYETTIGVDCKSRTFNHKNKKVKLQLWDTAGQERFKTVTTSYYRGTHCCILLFDITNQKSFFNLYQWIDQYTYYNDYPQKNIIIAGNKHDLEKDRQISRQEIDQFCQNLGCHYIEISVLENKGIDELMTLVVQKCLELQVILDQQKEQSQNIDPNQFISEPHKQGVKLKTDVEHINPVKVRIRKDENCC